MMRPLRSFIRYTPGSGGMRASTSRRRLGVPSLSSISSGSSSPVGVGDFAIRLNLNLVSGRSHFAFLLAQEALDVAAMLPENEQRHGGGEGDEGARLVAEDERRDDQRGGDQRPDR